MEKCRVYKGMDTPCKIRGLFSRYFYVVLMIGILNIGILSSSLTSLLSHGGLSDFVLECAIGVGILFFAYSFFYKRSNFPKIKESKKVCTISNRELYNSLNNKYHG